MQDAVLKGIGAQGAPGPNVLDLLYRTDALSQYVAVSEVCLPLLPSRVHLTSTLACSLRLCFVSSSVAACCRPAPDP